MHSLLWQEAKGRPLCDLSAHSRPSAGGGPSVLGVLGRAPHFDLSLLTAAEGFMVVPCPSGNPGAWSYPAWVPFQQHATEGV